jgi:hypothetical protein
MMILIRFFKRIGSVIFNNCTLAFPLRRGPALLGQGKFKNLPCLLPLMGQKPGKARAKVKIRGCGVVGPLGGVVAGKENNNKNNMVINIISYTFLGIIFYLFMWDFKIFEILQIFIFSIFSFAINMFISDKFKLSNNKFIKILQKFVFINSILALIALFLYLFDVSIFNTVFL